jgi:hypothetical protein
MLKYHIQTIELSSVASLISFASIPQNFDDLMIQFSVRANLGSGFGFDDLGLRLNRDAGGNYQNAILRSREGSAQAGRGGGSSITLYASPAASATANTFGNGQIYLPNYTSARNKSVNIEGFSENNSATLVQGGIGSGVWLNTSAITSLTIESLNGWGFAQNSSISLYGIRRGSDGKTETASGGVITTSGGYTVHTFNTSGTFVANRNLDVEYVVVAGGGGGSRYDQNNSGSGGGAGGYRSSVIGESSGGGSSAEDKLFLTSGISYHIIVGSGGPGATVFGRGSNGANSTFANVTSIGGGGAGVNNSVPPLIGGSGGGAGAGDGDGSVGVDGTPNQGFKGGNTFTGGTFPGNRVGSGGGGAGAAGGNETNNGNAGSGGIGVSSIITGSLVLRAGGGGGGTQNNAGSAGAGGTGGGGAGGGVGLSGTVGTANTGGGGGGAGSNSSGASGNGANGGSGVVIIRYLTP